MSKQSFSDESNWKHEPHTEHHVKDKFGKGTTKRNWKKNLETKVESEGQGTKPTENSDHKAQ